MARTSPFLDGLTNAGSGSAFRQANTLDLAGPSPLKTAAGVRYTDGTDLQVTFSTGTTFNVGPGSGVTSSTVALNAGYPLVSSAVEPVVLTAGAGINPRIDVIYARVVDNGDNTSTIDITKVTGTAAPSPAVPAIPDANTIPLAQINIPAAATSNFSAATITDLRPWISQAPNPLGLRVLGAGASGALSLGTSYSDVPGASLSFATQRANVVCLVMAVFDFSNANGYSADNFGTFNVNGTDWTPPAEMVAATAGAGAPRTVVPQNWAVTLGAAGSYTFKLRGRKSASDGVAHNINYSGTGTGSTINVLVLG